MNSTVNRLSHSGKANNLFHQRNTETMTIQINSTIHNRQETAELLSALVKMKIRHLENQISSESTEEDIECREKMIMNLQDEWQKARQAMQSSGVKLELLSRIDWN